MSFLIRSSRKQNEGCLGRRNPISSRSKINLSVQCRLPIHRTASGSSQTQTQIHRNQTQKRNVSIIQEQTIPQSNISMAEVISDLRILEEHKVESQRLLDAARTSRIQHFHLQSDLESKLGTVKYRNGQMRTEQTHHHEQLSNGQRSLSSTMVSSANATKNLDEFDERLKIFHSTKMFLIFHQRRQETIIGCLRQKLMGISMLLSNHEQLLDSERSEAKQLESNESLLQTSLNRVLVSQSRLNDDITACQHELVILRQNLASAKTYEHDTFAKLIDVQKVKSETNKRGKEVASARHLCISELMAKQFHKSKDNLTMQEKLLAEQAVFDNLIANLCDYTVVEVDSHIDLPVFRGSLETDRCTIIQQESRLVNLKECVAKDKEYLQQQLQEAAVVHEHLNTASVDVGNEGSIELERENSFAKLLKRLHEVKNIVNCRHFEVDEIKQKQRDSELDKQFIELKIQELDMKKKAINEKCQDLRNEIDRASLAILKANEDEDAYTLLFEKQVSDEIVSFDTLKKKLASLELTLSEIQTNHILERQSNQGSDPIVSLRGQMSKLVLANPDLNMLNFKKYVPSNFEVNGREDLKQLARKCMKRIRDAKDKQSQLLRGQNKTNQEKLDVSGPNFEGRYVIKQTTVEQGIIPAIEQIRGRNNCTSRDDGYFSESSICIPPSTVPVASMFELCSEGAICTQNRPEALRKEVFRHRDINEISFQPIDKENVRNALSSSSEDILEGLSKKYQGVRKAEEEKPIDEPLISVDVKAVTRNLGRLFDLQSEEESQCLDNQKYEGQVEEGSVREALLVSNLAEHRVNKKEHGSRDNFGKLDRGRGKRTLKVKDNQNLDKSKFLTIANSKHNGFSLNKAEEKDEYLKSRIETLSRGATQQVRNVLHSNDHDGVCSPPQNRVTAAEPIGNKRGGETSFYFKKPKKATTTLLGFEKPVKQSQSDVDGLVVQVVLEESDNELRVRNEVDNPVRTTETIKEKTVSDSLKTQMIERRNKYFKPDSMVVTKRTVKVSLPKGENTNESGYPRNSKRRRSSHQNLAEFSDRIGNKKVTEHGRRNSNSHLSQKRSDLGHQSLECFAQDQAYSFL